MATPNAVEAVAAVGWRCPAMVESATVGYLFAAAQGLGDGGEEGRQAGGAADELGDEDGGVVLRLDAVDPLQWRGRAACVRSALSVYMVRCI